MGGLLRMVVAVAVMVIPGALALACAYVAARMIRSGLLTAKARANGGQIQLRDVLAELNLRAIVREARLLAA